jgi:hypothetical protein
MSIDWSAVLTSIGQTAVIVGAGAWALKAALGHLLSRDLEKHKTSLTTTSARELEELRSRLAEAASERNTTFVQLHTRRSDVIAMLYELLVEAEEQVENFIDPRRTSTDDGTPQAYEGAFDALRALLLYFRRHRIYLELRMCESVERLFDAMHGPAWDTSYFHVVPEAHREASKAERQARVEAWSRFKDGVPPIMRELEQAFRRLLGVEAIGGTEWRDVVPSGGVIYTQRAAQHELTSRRGGV